MHGQLATKQVMLKLFSAWREVKDSINTITTVVRMARLTSLSTATYGGNEGYVDAWSAIGNEGYHCRTWTIVLF